MLPDNPSSTDWTGSRPGRKTAGMNCIFGVQILDTAGPKQWRRESDSEQNLRTAIPPNL